jgi:glycine/D-amino acid oxidase-like deaminating enzyme
VKPPGWRRHRLAAEADVAVVGAGAPALLSALELRSRGASVILLADAAAGAPPQGLGLALLGPGRPYRSVANAIGRAAAQLVWGAGCENQLRLKAFAEAANGIGYRAGGSFLVAETRAQAEALAESEDMLRDDGFPGEFLDHYMLETSFDVTGFRAAYWAAADAELDPAALHDSVARAADAAGVVRRAGKVRAVRDEPRGVRVELEDGLLLVTAVVVASDGQTGELVPEVAPLLRLTDARRLALAQRAGSALPAALRTADGRLACQVRDSRAVVAETREPGLPSADESLTGLVSRLPLDPASAEEARERTEISLDGFPVVGRLGARPLAVACGFSGLAPGFAFAAARFVTDALLRGADPTPEALRPTRRPLELPEV